MTNFTDKDLERLAEMLAPKIVEKVQSRHHEFWIDPETHYQDHYEWKKARSIWESGLRIFWTAFIGLVVVGAIALVLIGKLTWSDVKITAKMITITRYG